MSFFDLRILIFLTTVNYCQSLKVYFECTFPYEENSSALLNIDKNYIYNII